MKPILLALALTFTGCATIPQINWSCSCVASCNRPGWTFDEVYNVPAVCAPGDQGGTIEDALRPLVQSKLGPSGCDPSQVTVSCACNVGGACR